MRNLQILLEQNCGKKGELAEANPEGRGTKSFAHRPGRLLFIGREQ